MRPRWRSGRRVVVVTPVRNEESLLPKTIDSMVQQTVMPVLWVIVDDGSTDRTASLAEAAARSHPWIRVVRRSDRGRRELGRGVVHAFNDGLATVDVAWDFIGKLDGDMTFGPRYIERMMELFETDARLGSASGKVFRPEGDRLVEEYMIDDMVAGQWKLYRRSCFEAIGGLVPSVLWDGIDFHRARQRGFVTRSSHDHEVALIHHRLMGSSDRGVLRGRVRLGLGQWFMGTHPLYLLASAGFRAFEKPYLVGGVCMVVGYLLGMLRGDERYGEPGFREELRSYQLGRLRRLVLKAQVRR